MDSPSRPPATQGIGGWSPQSAPHRTPGSDTFVRKVKDEAPAADALHAASAQRRLHTVLRRVQEGARSTTRTHPSTAVQVRSRRPQQRQQQRGDHDVQRRQQASSVREQAGGQKVRAATQPQAPDAGLLLRAVRRVAFDDPAQAVRLNAARRPQQLDLAAAELPRGALRGCAEGLPVVGRFWVSCLRRSRLGRFGVSDCLCVLVLV